jgi:glutaryl-CoA dehydrogenase
VEGRFPKELVPEMAELGVFGANLPEEYGCAGLNNVAYGLIMQELERGDSGVRSFASVQGALAMYPIFAFGSEDQRRAWLPKMAQGEVIGCFGLTEPDFGSNPAGMITMAQEQADGSWLLNGGKMWITNGSTAQIAVVWAKTNSDKSERSIRGFIVPTNSKGFKARDQKGKLSLRASDTSELVFEDVHLPNDAVLPKSGGLKSPLMCLTQARYGISWGAIGAAIACFEEAVSYSKNRVMFDRPIGGFQRSPRRSSCRCTSDGSRTPARIHHSRSRSPSGTTSTSRPTLLVRHAGCSARWGSLPNMARCATWPTSRASILTRERTTSTPWSWVRP